MIRIAFAGKIHLDHDDVLSRLLDNFTVAESDLIQFPAGGTPIGIKINDNRFLSVPRNALSSVFFLHRESQVGSIGKFEAPFI